MTLTRQLNIHTKESSHYRRHIDNDRDGGQTLHDTIQIIRNNRSEGIHHTRKDLSIDAGHLNGLLVFSEHIFKQFLIVLIIVEDLHALDTLHHYFVGAQRGGEIGEALL